MSNQQQQKIITAEEELLDSTAQSVLRHILDGDGNIIDMSSNNNNKRNLQNGGVVHDNTAEELNANDESGMQGGQVWQAPTTKPTSQPSISSSPTATPTFAPVLNSLERTLRGVMWYDRNGNGVRDSNVEVSGFSNDVEFEFGVGGVQVQLVECDPVTGGQLANADNFASTMTVGFDALMRPQIVPSNDMGGKFNIHLEGLNRYYYVQVQAPSGLLLTSGVCNDDEVGWACDTSTAVTFAQGRDRELSSSSSSSSSSGAAALITPASIENSHRALEGEVPIGISSGRSSLCMFVDGDGNVESSFNFGVMRVGDTQNMVSNVALVLEFDNNISSSGGGRRLSEIIRRATIVDEVNNGSSGITTRYLLADEDRVAIGTVTAEVIAGTLDGRLAANGVNLDSVDPKEVIMSHTRPTDAASAAAAEAKLAVGMEIRGHYSPPPDLDFDYIVQDSINRDTATIRRGLREFNRNCREQTSKVNKEGLQESDFEAVISTSGAARPGRGGGRPTTTGGRVSLNNGNVFSTACSSDFLVPQYFETSLKEIETRELSEVQKLFGDATYVANDGLDSWAMGPVAGLSGLIILLMGAFVFRRALGPRSVDKFSDFNKTKDISKDETRRFGEAFDDDDSVDSAFYSDHDDDSDMELTEKERKMRRKRKEKEDEQRKSKSGGKTAKERAAERKALAKSTTKKYRKSARKGESSSSDVRKSSRKTEVTISQGSDDTGSLSDDEREKKRAAKERAAERKRLAQSEGPHRKSTSSKKKSSRGRNRSSGGDNRKLAASIV